MKKWICAGLAALMLLCAACQKTPEQPFVMQKDQQQMVETARGEAGAEGKPPVRVQAAAPERLVFQREDGKLSISADAAVYVPDVTRMPVYRVAAADFTQEQVRVFWDELVGDKPMIRQRERDAYTRSEIERLILMYQKQLAELPEDEMRFHTDLTPEEWLLQREKSIQQEIANLRAKLVTAPETLLPEPEDGTLRQMTAYGAIDAQNDGVIGSYEGVDAYLDGVCTFEVKNNVRYAREHGEKIGAELLYGSREISRVSRGNFVEHAVPVDGTTALSAAQLAQIGYTPAEARALAEALLAKTGAPFAVKRMWLFEAGKTYRIERGIPDSDAHMVYHVECERIVGGAACATGFQTAYDVSDKSPAYHASWAYESFDVIVDRDGIACVCWDSPYALGEELVYDSALLPFSEIQAVFEQMMRVTWLPQTEGIAQLTLYVTDVRLELMRIREANSWSSGLLIPVWNFSGVRERTFLADFNNETDRTIVIPLLCVNAIDGSIIDPYQGY